MNEAKYIGLDVHQTTISVAILDSAGKLMMKAILETKTATILQFVHGLRGSLHVTFEEGTWARLYDLLKPHLAQVLVCDPRKYRVAKIGNKNDCNDARELAELLWRNKIATVYHGEHGLRTLKELARSYLTTFPTCGLCGRDEFALMGAFLRFPIGFSTWKVSPFTSCLASSRRRVRYQSSSCKDEVSGG